MKPLNYTTISDNISQFLDFKDTYRYFCLSLTPHKSGYTDSTFEQIKNITGDNSLETIKDFVDRLRKSNYIKVETVFLNEVRRNHYHLKINKEGFRMIESSFLNVGLDMAHKGFLIQLLGMCFGLTLTCSLTQTEIASRMKVSRQTVSTYIKKLIELGFINKNGKELTIICDSFISETKFNNQVKERIIKLAEIEQFKVIISNTKWENINNPTEYLNKMEMGLFNKKQELNQTFKNNLIII